MAFDHSRFEFEDAVDPTGGSNDALHIKIDGKGTGALLVGLGDRIQLRRQPSEKNPAIWQDDQDRIQLSEG